MTPLGKRARGVVNQRDAGAISHTIETHLATLDTQDIQTRVLKVLLNVFACSLLSPEQSAALSAARRINAIETHSSSRSFVADQRRSLHQFLLLMLETINALLRTNALCQILEGVRTEEPV